MSAHQKNQRVVTKSRGMLSAWLDKLVTKEDAFHGHKTLGILVLISFAWRLSQVGASDMGFATHPAWTVPTLVLHLLLNVSAFGFDIPPKRIESGYRIWPEYRIHSLVFLCRALATMTIMWFEDQYVIQPPNYWLNYIVVLASMAAADAGSWSCGPYQSHSIRNLPVPNYVRYFFSVAQFYATAGILLGLRQRWTIPFVQVMIVQGNAFLMTVRRKNLVGQRVLVGIYGVGLVVGMFLTAHEYLWVGIDALCMAVVLANLATLLRLGPTLPRFLKNKYVMWTLLGYFCGKLRPLIIEDRESEAILSSVQVRLLSLASCVGVILLGRYNCSHAYQKKSKES